MGKVIIIGLIFVLMIWLGRQAWSFWSAKAKEDNANAKLADAMSASNILDIEEKTDEINEHNDARTHTEETEK